MKAAPAGASTPTRAFDPDPLGGTRYSCEADLPKITATGYREDFTGLEDGIGVPEVFARLVEHEHSNTFDPFVVQLCIVKPGSSGEVGESATGWLTLHEAGLLAKALTELQGVARSAR
jgi:hypothetical protein